MHDSISVHGITTNNLKNIDISIKKHKINIIIGPSGSGKSSLAYDTVAKIGQHEFNSMFADMPLEPNYKVRAYSNMVATIPIKQSNTNHNIRSTVGTYFSMSQHIAIVFSALLSIPYDFFVLNKEENACPKCRGLGLRKELDVNRLINYDTPLEKCPVACWTRYKDFYCEIIRQYCSEVGIDYTKNFRTLSEKERNQFLYGESKKKFSIRYKKTGYFSRRTTRFFGVLTEQSMMPNLTPAKQFYADQICPLCAGQKYSIAHNEVKLFGLSIGEVMCTPFERLDSWLTAVRPNAKGVNLDFLVAQLSAFIAKAVELNLGHLFFNRTIPSLSGGELQRLRLVQVFNTQLSDLLIVLDEPLAGLSGEEKQTVFKNVKTLANNHTLLIVDHHDMFFKDAGSITALGKESGKYGGEIVNPEHYIKAQRVMPFYQPLRTEKLLHIIVKNRIYNYTGIDISIASERLNIITGKSGIGKTTLLREYFPQYFENYIYINQKPLQGNIHSSVATVLDILHLIVEGFAKKHNKDKRFFWNLAGCDGACPFCSGAGAITYGNDYQDKLQMVCADCEGTGFNKNLKNFRLNDNSIFDIWGMTVDEAFNFYEKQSPRIASVLSGAREIMLGHLQIGQPTTTLSGGENIRLKVLKSLRDAYSVYGIDEPFRGLSNTEIYRMVCFFDKFIVARKTLVIVDHEEESFRYFTRIITLTNDNGKLVENH